MSEESLKAPNRVEYVVLAPRKNRGVLIASLSAGVVTIVGAFLPFLHYRNTPHIYKPIALPAIGLNAHFRTKWVDGAVQYIFHVKPIAGTESRFISFLQSIPHDQLHFDIQLLDTDGFEVCKGSPTMQTIIGSDGQPVGMRASESLTFCSREQMRSASRWNVTYRYPALSSDLNPQVAPRDSSIHTELTGSDFSNGDLETLDQGSFRISRKAEYTTLMGWRSPDDIEILCQQNTCLVKNLRTQETVHTRKR